MCSGGGGGPSPSFGNHPFIYFVTNRNGRIWFGRLSIRLIIFVLFVSLFVMTFTERKI